MKALEILVISFIIGVVFGGIGLLIGLQTTNTRLSLMWATYTFLAFFVLCLVFAGLYRFVLAERVGGPTLGTRESHADELSDPPVS